MKMNIHNLCIHVDNLGSARHLFGTQRFLKSLPYFVHNDTSTLYIYGSMDINDTYSI